MQWSLCMDPIHPTMWLPILTLVSIMFWSAKLKARLSSYWTAGRLPTSQALHSVVHPQVRFDIRVLVQFAQILMPFPAQPGIWSTWTVIEWLGCPHTDTFH